MAKIRTPAAYDGYRGKLGPLVFRSSPYGTQMLQRQSPRQANTPAQVAARDRLRRVGQAWRALNLAEATAWRQYAKSLGPQADGTTLDPNNAFSRLALRVLQVNPAAAIPTLPPTVPFGGDSMAATLGTGTETFTLQVSKGNGPGLVTEVLAQRLASIHRATYDEKYRSQGFSAWAAGTTISISAKPGIYAVAIRVVKVATGESGAILPMGVVTV